MKIEIAFGIVLKKTRENNKLTQAQLSFESGLDRTFISLLERGERQPSLSSIFQIATALNIKPEYMIKLVSELIDESNQRRNIDR